MAEFYQPKLEIAELQRRASAVLEKDAEQARAEGSARPLHGLPGLSLQPPFVPKERRAGYHAAELLQFHDETFVGHAYRVLLGREPDPPGVAGYLTALRSGQINRLDVLARLRFSPEGMRRGVALKGVRGPAVLRRAYRVPFVGPALRWVVSLARLPRLVRHVNQIEAHLIAQQEQIAAYTNELNRHYSEQVAGHVLRLDDLARQQRELENWHKSATATYAEMAQVSLMQFAEEFNGNLARLAAAQQETAALTRQLDARQHQTADAQLEQLTAQREELHDALLHFEQQLTAQLATEQQTRATQLAQQRELLTAQEQNIAAQLAQQRQILTAQITTQQQRHAEQIAAQRRDFTEQQQAAAQQLAQLAEGLATARTELNAQTRETAREFAARLAELTQQETAQRLELAAQWAAAAAQTQQQQAALAAHYESLAAQFAAAEAARNAFHSQYDAAQIQAQEDLRREATRANEQAQAIRAEVVLQGGRVERLLTLARKRLPAAPLNEAENAQLLTEAQHTLDAFYVALEDRLRGSREMILERLRVYLPLLRENNLGTAERPVLDLGCGRGEWLELLRAEGFTASGVELNQVLTEQCRALSLQVAESDILAYLRDLPDASCGGVTCFHVVEHLPLESVLTMLNEVLRVLQPGGLAIFETPNPRNVLVGSCNFYYDPTHRNPVPSPVLQFMLEARGFARVQVLNLNPSDAQPVAGEEDIVRRFNDYFYGPMDYAAIGWKPSLEK